MGGDRQLHVVVVYDHRTSSWKAQHQHDLVRGIIAEGDTPGAALGALGDRLIEFGYAVKDALGGGAARAIVIAGQIVSFCRDVNLARMYWATYAAGKLRVTPKETPRC